jgi:hypothetical protein
LSSSSACFLLLLCGHAFREKSVDSVLLAPVVILPNLIQGYPVIACSQFGLEAVGEVALR